MREALTSIRADLGEDAVMLSSRKLPTGVEVIAAVDYDGSLLGGAEMNAADEKSTRELDTYEQVARRQAAPEPAAPPAPPRPAAPAAAASAPAPATATAPAPAPAA